MRDWVRLVIAALVGASLTLLVPAVASTVARFARNSDRVDGFHAVAADVSKAARAGKLVATGDDGYLPNDILRKARNASRLRGNPPVAYEPSPCRAQLAGRAFVPATGEDVVGGAFVNHMAGHDKKGNPLFGCDTRPVTVEHPMPGVYEVDFGGAAHCTSGDPSIELQASVTVKSELGTALTANTATVCGSGDAMLERVFISDEKGQPTDAPFVIALFGQLPVPPIP